MDQHTTAAKNWLDRRYSRSADGRYKAHQPICGLHTQFAEPNALVRFARTYRLIEWLHALEFESVLDIGGGEGYLSALIRDLLGPKVAHSSDLSVEANLRAWELFGINGLSSDASRLPFADGAYDLVICSEVIEHLSRPALAIGELMRVARKYVIVSTAEFSPLGERERQLRVLTLDRDYPHAELNWFTPNDFRLLMGDDTVLSPQYGSIAHRLPTVERTREDVERILVKVTEDREIGVDQIGVIAIKAKTGAPPRAARLDATASQRTLERLLEGPPPHPAPPVRSQVDEELHRRLRCVRCGSAMRAQVSGVSLECSGCSMAYPVKDGVPAMLTEDAGPAEVAKQEAESAARMSGGDAARRQRIAALMMQLHNSRAGRHGAAVHWLAGQSLRLMWLVGRQEPVTAKVKRVIGRLFGGGDSGEAATLAALSRPSVDATAVAAPTPARTPQS